MTLAITHTFVSAIADDAAASAAGEVLPSHWNASHTLTGTVTVAQGGTGQTAYTIGDILYADTTSTLKQLSDVATGNVLISGGVGAAPSWGKVDLTSAVSNYLPRTVNAQTGASYTILASDIGKLVTTSNAGAVAITLPQATGSFAAGAIIWVENKGAGTATITPTTSTIDGSATLALTTNQGVTLVSDGTNYTTIRGIGGAGGGTPGGSATQLQYNNTGAFGGISGSAVSTAGGVTLNNGTLTASDPLLNLAQTWNLGTTVFTAVKLNVVNTLSAAGSLLMDLQVGGTSQHSVDKNGYIQSAKNGAIGLGIFDAGTGIGRNSSVGGLNLYGGGSTPSDSNAAVLIAANAGVVGAVVGLDSRLPLGWFSSNVTQGVDVAFSRVAAALLEVNTGTAAAVAYLRLNAVAVASLPAASATYKGARGTVSDANATTFGTTVAGGGANVMPVFCNGTAWIIG